MSKTKLSEVCSLITKGTTPNTIGFSFQDTGVNFIKIESINEYGSFVTGKFQHISAKCHESMKRSQLQENDILFSIAGALGRIGIVTSDILPANINQALAIIRLSSSKCLPKYITYSLKSNYVIKQFKRQQQGVAQLNLSLRNINDLEILLPSLETQKQVAKTLDTTADLLAMRKKRLAELDNLIKSTFYELFGDPVANEKGWEYGKIKDLSSSISYGTSQKASSEVLAIPILRMNNITYQGDFDFTQMKYIEMDEKDKQKYLVRKGEILFNRTNSKELVGKTAVYRNDQPMAFAGYLVRLIPNEKANSEFISAYLNSGYGKKLLLKMAKNIVGMANINAKELGNIDLYIPPLPLQNQFAEIVAKIEEQKALVKQAIEETQLLFDSLMSEYFDA
ncbi:restriction endonuclease subunit S [Paenibacillus sp. HB172176]|uniref:restriction endonuclease subunit S n=1 Tax=Paenibacillus sp. HB172176 TaxID=2493690 RepID=UPI00143C6CE2|nr:restriction endonuclease subunit S [Paenibacillus sp. HB172176]